MSGEGEQPKKTTPVVTLPEADGAPPSGEKIPILDYRTPEPEASSDDSSQRGAAGCFSAVLLVLGLPFLAGGIGGALIAFQGWNRFVRNYLSDVTIWLLMGTFCLTFAIRWARFSIRGK